MSVIIYTKDNTLHVVHPAGKWKDNVRGLLEKAVPDGVTDAVIIEREQIPTDRTYRDAWEAKSGKVSVDMVRARNIHMGRIRVKRDERLKELDVETMKGNDVQAEKQKLRDLPQTFDLSAASTPEELKALWPSEL